MDMQRNVQTRSMGFKLITVGVMALLMTVPAFLLDRLVEDRSQRAIAVSESIGSVAGGPQMFLGPVLAIPYTVPDDDDSKKRVDQGVYVIFPAKGDAAVWVKSEVRHRSLFKVTVYSAAIDFKASFDLTQSPVNLPPDGQLDWSRAEFITGASDSRGALADATLNGGGTTSTMGLSGLGNRLALPSHAELGLKLFGLRAGKTVGPNSKFDITAALKFSGSRTLSILPYGRTSSITVKGDWPNPSFNGGFLPVSRNVSTLGFDAHWSIPFIARGVAAEGTGDLIHSLSTIAPSVSFVELADPYQSVTRSLKYCLLFILLVFAAFFFFETTTGKRVHPAQYFLVGAAQLIFYLLLLSIAERIGFGAAFAIASAATVSLISLNARWIFASRREGVRAFIVFSLIYSLIYFLLTLEDQALLVGAVASFLAIAVIMYVTRSIDWYVSTPPAEPVQ